MLDFLLLCSGVCVSLQDVLHKRALLPLPIDVYLFTFFFCPMYCIGV
jgi:hypothetical protein